MFPVHLFWPVVKIRCRAWCARIRTLSLSSAVREAAARKFLDDLCPVGQNPLDFTIVTKAWAGVYLVFSSTTFFAHTSGETLCVVIRLLFWYPFSLAGIDDCDYNLHLSNSSYPKVSSKHYSFSRRPPECFVRWARHGDEPMRAEGDDPERDGGTLMWYSTDVFDRGIVF
jgi:hypothetical protein